MNKTVSEVKDEIKDRMAKLDRILTNIDFRPFSDEEKVKMLEILLAVIDMTTEALGDWVDKQEASLKERQQ